MQSPTVNSLLRISQAYCEQLCEKQTLEYGIVFSSPRFPELAECNQFREVIAETLPQAGVAVDECDQCFAARGSRCLRWAPAEGRTSEEIARFLTDRGFVPRQELALTLSRWVGDPPTREIRVLPARAMRDAFAKTFASSGAGRGLEDEQREAALERLDSSHLDMFVALYDGEPAGRGGLFQVGDVCELVDVSVLAGFTGRGVDSALVSQALSLARRLAFRRVYARFVADDDAKRDLLLRHGFVADGSIVEFVRP